MAKENRNFKDSVFTDLFYSDENAPKNLLSLYNALYGTNYTDPTIIQKIRLEDVFFKNFKNDIAFTADKRRIVLGEHQSTVSPNMPLRNLMYIGREYEQLIPAHDRYTSKLIKIPTPEFITFYNGIQTQPDEQILSLSDAFIEKDESSALELSVRVININPGHNREFLSKCPVLEQYSTFVNTTRKYKSDKNTLEKTIKECIANGILQEYLQRKSGEVVNMLMAEYDYELDMQVQREEAAEEAAKKATEIANQKAREAIEKAQKESQEAQKETQEAKKETQEAKKETQEAKKETQEAKKEVQDTKEKLKNSQIETASRMLAMNQFSPEVIAQISGLSEREVLELAQAK